MCCTYTHGTFVEVRGHLAFFSFRYMSPRDKTQAIGLGGRCLYPLSCLTCLSLDVGEA